MKMIRIAQIGTSQNSHGNSIWCSFKKQSDLFEIVGYALPENEREKFPGRMADFEGYREMTVEEILSDPTIDAVAVETEEIYLTKYAQMVADAKKHMHMEKPGGIDLAAFEKLIATVKANGTVFHTGYMYRYNSYVMELKEDIRAGKLGEIISVEAQMNCLHPATVRDWLKCFPGGMMFFLGCHLVDLIYSIQGAPKRIIPMSKCTGIDGVEGEDFGMAAFEYDKGWSFAKTNANEHSGFGRRQLVVNGTKGTVELKPLEWYVEGKSDLYTGRRFSDAESWTYMGEKEYNAPADRYDTMMASFAAMVRGEKENPWNYDYELELYRLVLAACGK
ncbi:MAG: Gfo/Idh/MocA family oxidoreductase [Clostridia bacterium]|nr:Gfo/Idh/MocA family oxidoreductase [Clostridia bacterium]